MAPQNRLPLAALAGAAALLVFPVCGLTGSTSPSPISIVVQVSPSASFKVQNAADFTTAAYTGMTDAPPVLLLNTTAVKPEVIVEVSADVAGPITSDGDGGEQVSLKDLGVAPPPPSNRLEGSDLKETFERAAGEIIYRLDLINRLNVGRQSPVVVSINL